MKTIPETYADGVETIHVLNGAARLGMFTLRPPQGEGSPVPQVFERIVMPIQAFLNMHAAMQQIVDKMIEDGLITPNASRNHSGEA